MKRFLLFIFILCIHTIGFSQIKSLNEIIELYHAPYDSVQHLLKGCWLNSFGQSDSRSFAMCETSKNNLRQGLTIAKSLRDSNFIEMIIFQAYENEMNPIINEFVKYNLKEVTPNSPYTPRKYHTYYSGYEFSISIARYPNYENIITLIIHPKEDWKESPYHR